MKARMSSAAVRALVDHACIGVTYSRTNNRALKLATLLSDTDSLSLVILTENYAKRRAAFAKVARAAVREKDNELACLAFQVAFGDEDNAVDMLLLATQHLAGLAAKRTEQLQQAPIAAQIGRSLREKKAQIDALLNDARAVQAALAEAIDAKGGAR